MADAAEQAALVAAFAAAAEARAAARADAAAAVGQEALAAQAQRFGVYIAKEERAGAFDASSMRALIDRVCMAVPRA